MAVTLLLLSLFLNTKYIRQELDQDYSYPHSYIFLDQTEYSYVQHLVHI